MSLPALGPRVRVEIDAPDDDDDGDE